MDLTVKAIFLQSPPHLYPPLCPRTELLHLILLHRCATVIDGRLPVQFAARRGDVCARERTHGTGGRTQDHQFEGFLIGAVLVLDVDAVFAGVLTGENDLSLKYSVLCQF